MGIAPTFAVLLLGFVIYGLASGPLAHTADVVLVEVYPKAPGRIFTRATLLDTVGALLASLLVTVTFLLGLEWRWLMVALGLSSLIYAIIIVTTRFPARQNDNKSDHTGTRQLVWANIKTVLTNRRSLSWLLFLFVFAVAEAPIMFATIWLREEVGMSQALIGVYKALEMAISVVSLIYLDRWLSRKNFRHILLVAGLGVALIYPVWLFAPGITLRFALSIPLVFLFTVFWPIGRAQLLVSAPGYGGTLSAIQSVAGLVPLPLLFGLLAEATSLTSAMLWVTLSAAVIMIVVVWFIPSSEPVSLAASGHED
jgi:MFS family permease